MFSQRYCKAWSALHAFRGFRMQSNAKGNRLPFATAKKGIWALLANCQRVMEHRMQYTLTFSDFLDFAAGSWFPFALCKKELDTFWSRKKGASNPFCSARLMRVFLSNPHRIHSRKKDRECDKEKGRERGIWDCCVLLFGVHKNKFSNYRTSSLRFDIEKNIIIEAFDGFASLQYPCH